MYFINCSQKGPIGNKLVLLFCVPPYGCIRAGQGRYIQGRNIIRALHRILKLFNLQDVTDLSVLDQGGEWCNKDTGSKQCLQRRIRGVFLIISGGGIIRKFAPLYTSESPTQAAFILISFLLNILKDVPKECWSDLVLAYDNM